MSDTVLCKDCKHARWNPFKLYTWYCHKQEIPAKIEIDPVRGPKAIKAYYEACSIARIGRSDRTDRCGEKGIFWEPKRKKDLFKYITHVSAE